ncbi:MAG TPA: hypothetical protein VHC68_03020 [Candidatus Paceibacterota bacterium]|nr:hypothetical protein [Candidatus Paceibacterota bacterium]
MKRTFLIAFAAAAFLAVPALARADTATYCFTSFSATTWDSTPTQIVDCNTADGTNDNNNGHHVHLDASEYTSGGSGTITKVELRVYYKNNWAASATTRNNVAQLVPYFGGTSEGSAYNDALGNHATAGWSAYFDITSDASAPASWSWSDIAGLDVDLIDDRPSSGQITVYRVEMRVTYTPAGDSTQARTLRLFEGFVIKLVSGTIKLLGQ